MAQTKRRRGQTKRVRRVAVAVAKAVSQKPQAKRPTKAFSEKVSKVLSRNAEHKVITYNITDQPECFTAAYVGFPTGNYTVLTPSESLTGYNIITGSGNATRVGNRVTTKSLKFDYVLSCNPYNAATNTKPRPVAIRFYFFKSKIQASGDVTLSQLQNTFFENGVTSTGFVGTLTDLNKRICPDNFTYQGHRTFKLGNAIVSQTGSSAGDEFYANNDFKLNHVGSVDCTKWCPKVIKWNDSAEVNSPWLFFFCQVLGADNVIIPPTEHVCTLSITTIFKYIDV